MKNIIGNISPFFTRIINKLSYVFLFLTVLYLTILCIKVISIKQPIEVGEGSFVITTDLLLKGKDPFSLGLMPAYANLYGIAQNFINYPIAYFFGSNLIIHRLINVVSIYLTGIVIYIYTKRKTNNILMGLFASTILVSQMILNLQNITAKPDALGMLFFVLSIYLPELYSYNVWSLAISSIFSIIAFYTKPYFILSLIIVPVYLTIFKNREKGFCLLLTNSILLLLSILIINSIYEAYFLNTVINQFYAVNRNIFHLIGQLIQYITINFSLFFLLVFYIYKRKFQLFNLKYYSWQFRKDITLSGFTLLISLLVVVTIMGWHTGSNLYYFVQLISPFFVTYILTLNFQINLKSQFVSFLFILNISFFVLSSFKLFSEKDGSDRYLNWYNKINHFDRVYNSASIALLQHLNGKIIFDNGYSEYYKIPINGPDAIPIIRKAKIKYYEYKSDINQKLINQQFDAIILTSNNKFHTIDEKLLKENYSLSEWRDFSVLGSYRVEELWIPKPSPEAMGQK